MSNVWEVAGRPGPVGSGDDGADITADAAREAGESGHGLPDSAAGQEETPVEEIIPLGLDAAAPSGDAVVDRAVSRLTQADVLPTERHGEVYEDVHRELRDVLAELDR